ncbi:hypothetical protein Patl1_24494 [Pistacia atlantica]|uniref:Uncharacterized protein n=1 Tax=Pistacia atlantica TaxID=434234 RepID=A0ACC1A2E5_9ROSI|nr:hypothetical protein Patl1_24494 [Pistacia atlantica]
MRNKKGKLDDITWGHCKKVNEENRLHLTCNYCGIPYWGGVIRMKNHLAGTHIQVKPCSQVPEDVKMKFQELLVAKKVNKDDDDDDDDMLVGDYGRGLKPPTYHEARVSYLKREVDLVEEKLGKYKNEWKKNGCTLMSDGWMDGNGRSLTNFLVNSPSGTVFLKSVDTSEFIKNAQKMFELLDSVVEEIGEEHVVQVVTDGASNYVAAGRMLEEKRRKLFWSPCAAHCLDLILEDIGKIAVFYDTIAKAKQVTMEVLRLVDGDAKPAIGYIYEAMRRAKNQIAKNFNNVEHRYREIWKIIDTRWDFQLHRPLHAAAYYLNPKYHYDPNFNPDKEVKIGLYKVIEKIYPDVETRVEVDAQLDKFKRGVGLFGMDMAIITRDKKQPDPCLPDDNSWMDIQECFNIDEGAPSNKRARGPRNLNASNKKAKEKVVEEEDVLPILCDEDGESEEEDLLAILHDNNNTSEVEFCVVVEGMKSGFSENLDFLLKLKSVYLL